MHHVHHLVRMVEAASLVFGASWVLAYLFGHRVRRGHWIVSLAYIAALLYGSYWLVGRLHGPAPGGVWWAPLALIALVTVALTEKWNALGQACMASTLSLSLAFWIYLVVITVRSHLGPLSLVLSAGLLALQTFALILLCAGGYEILDVLCRIRWSHIADPRPVTDWFPRVSLHVPAYNEPPEMVIETLEALARLDYPNYEVIVIDNNTTDERLWRPVEERCRALGFKFFHLDHWPGFKSGALNYGLTRTDPEAEIVGVVDSDYVVAPDYLRRCVGFFRDPAVAFVQTPQDYRDVSPGDPYAVACYHAYLYFFKISMVSRNEHNGIIFAGTMGLIRKAVLQDLGGWDEWCITEDAEISLRILDRGYRGVYVDRSFGQGLMPLNFEGLKKQRFRWAFGGMQILRRHWEALLPWSRLADPDHRMTLAQKWDYLMGGLQWLNDPLTFSFTLLLLIGSAALSIAHSLFIQPLAPAVLYIPFLFVFVGVTRFLWALRHRVGCGVRRAAAAFVILLGLTWVVTMACVLGLVKKQGVFLRTPKKRATADPWRVLRVVIHETGLAALCLAAAALLVSSTTRSPHVLMMSGLLVWQSLIYVSAPVSSVLGHRSEMRALHPAYLASPRTTGQRVSSMISDRKTVWSLAGIAALVAALFTLAVLLAPEEERIFRNNPERLSLIPSSMMRTPPESQVKAILYLEKEAALSGDVDTSLALWDPNGVIRDANYTDSDPSDDRVWVGIDAVRRRYTEEFLARRYLSLAHQDASVIIEGDRAVVVNDLRAEIATATGTQTVFLSRGDRWTLTRGPAGWRITELVVNRAPR